MARKPFRSRPAGCLCIVLGLAGFASIFLVNWRPFGEPWSGALWFIFSLGVGGPLLIILGFSLLRRDAGDILANPRIQPIVYLRPFAQERVTSPGNAEYDDFTERYPVFRMPGFFFVIMFVSILFQLAVTGLLQLLDLQPQALKRVSLAINGGWIALVLLFLCYCALRAMRGEYNVTLEQEVCHHFRKFGPIVAVGRPGDWFAPPGGKRVYLDDDAWQTVVIDLIERARIIVVHLVPVGWTWWEFCQSFTRGDPRRVLAVVIGQFYNDESYASLRQMMQQEFGVSLRDKKDAHAIIAFDADRTPHYLPLKLIPWPLFPFRTFRLSRSTFKPFLSGIGLTHRFSREWCRQRLNSLASRIRK